MLLTENFKKLVIGLFSVSCQIHFLNPMSGRRLQAIARPLILQAAFVRLSSSGIRDCCPLTSGHFQVVVVTPSLDHCLQAAFVRLSSSGLRHCCPLSSGYCQVVVIRLLLSGCCRQSIIIWLSLSSHCHHAIIRPLSS